MLIAQYKYYKPTHTIDTDSILYQIPEPITFDGSGYIDTGIQLLKDDSDWTLFLECIPNIDNKTQAVIHCVDESNVSCPGVSLSLEPNGNIDLWDGTKETLIGDGYYLNKKIKIVIVKKDNNIIVYHNYSSSIQYQRDYPIIIPYTFKSANTTLSIGGGHNGASALHTFSGVINNFVIYNKALESEDCESIIGNDPRPIFNDNNNFNYTIEDKYLDTEDTVTRSIYADTDFTSCSFDGENGLATVEYLKVTNKVTTMDSMFYNCFNMTSVNANGWDTSNVTSMIETFSYCCHLEEITGIENWDTSSLTNLACTFNCCCVSLISLNLSSWDTSKVTNMYGTFGYCCNLEEIIGIENWDTSSVTDLSSIFECCEWLTSLDLSKWDTSKVTNMCETFCWCCRLEEIIGIENWDTSSLEDLTYTFMCCESLTSLNLSGWDTSKVTLSDETFSNCTYLEELDLSNWDLSNADPYWMSYMFYIAELDPDSEDWYDPDFKPYLKTIKCNNANTISLLAPYLPDRSTCEEAGIIITDNASEVNAEELADLNWKVVMLVARYTTNASGIIPTFNSGYVYEVNEVDNGDGTYTVKIYSYEDFTSCSFNEKIQLLTVEYLKVTSHVTSMENMFYGCRVLKSLDVSNWDTSNVTTMHYMFYKCGKLVNLDLSNFDISKVTFMSSMFNECTNLTSLNLNNWNINNLSVSMYNLFTNANKLNNILMNNSDYNSVNKIIEQLPTKTADNMGILDISVVDDINQVNISAAEAKYWNIEVTYLIAQYKFDKSIYENLLPEFNAEFTNYEIVDEYLDTEDIVITSTETMLLMNYDAEPDEYGILTTEYEVENISTFSAENIVTRSIYSTDLPTKIIFGRNSNTSEATNREKSLLEVNSLNINKLNTMLRMFKDCVNVSSINCNGDTSKVTNMNSMFWGCTSLTSLDVSSFNTSKVTTMGRMFQNCSSLTQLNVSNFDTSKVTDMISMFWGCTSLTSLDVSSFNTNKVITMNSMFYNCQSLTSIDTSNFNTSNVTNMNAMFNTCSSLTQLNVSNFDTSNVTDMQSMFAHCNILTSIDVSSFDTNKVITIKEMFYNCESLTSLDVSNWDTKNVTNMQGAFWGCQALTSLDVSKWDTKNVTNMSYLFYDCYSLTSIDVSKWDTSKVTSMYSIFRRCILLTSIDVSNWNTSKLGSCHAAFFGCSSLVKLNLSNWDVSNVGQCYWMFELCTSLVELNLSNWKLKDDINTADMFYGCKNLNYIILNNSNYTTVNILINRLLPRSESDPGVLRIAEVDDVSQVDMNLAKSKNWDIRITKPGPSKVELMTFNSGASNSKKIRSKHGNGHIVKIIFNK